MEKVNEDCGKERKRLEIVTACAWSRNRVDKDGSDCLSVINAQRTSVSNLVALTHSEKSVILHEPEVRKRKASKLSVRWE